jgi:hypothetical protein
MLDAARRTIFRLLECKRLHFPVLTQRAALTNGGDLQDGTQPKENYMDPTQINPVVFPEPALEQPVAVVGEASIAPAVVVEQQPLYPIGLIDFNKPFVIVDYHNDEETFDNPQILTVLKGSLYPVVVTFWKNGEQCVAQFNTDGEDEHAHYKVENDEPFPRTVFVVIGRDGRSLVADDEVYGSEDAARNETTLDEIVGIFPLTIEASVSVSDFHDGGVESDEIDGAEDDEEPDDIEGTETGQVVDLNQAPTEMYVAGRVRHVGETVHAYRNNFGVRACTIVKMRRDSRKSLYIDPKDGNDAYWALNKNVRY